MKRLFALSILSDLYFLGPASLRDPYFILSLSFSSFFKKIIFVVIAY